MQKQAHALLDQMQSALNHRLEKGLLRVLKTNSQPLVDFYSNDYLGFARDWNLKAQVDQAYDRLIQKMPPQSSILGSSGSRLLSGNHLFVEELEAKIAHFHQAEAGLIFSNGYLANLALLSTIMGKQDGVLIDEEAHASIWEGAKYSGASYSSFKHNNLLDLRKQLERYTKKYARVFVCIQTVYSTSGDLAKLHEITHLAEEFSALLIADEAHATGIFGSQGEGLIVQENLSHCFLARMHTFGKALGAYGAIILTHSHTKQFLINMAKPFIYSTAMPLYNYVLIDKAYDYMVQAQHRREKIKELIKYSSQSAINSKLSSKPARSPIQSILVDNACQADQLSLQLKQKGFQVLPLKPPTTRKNRVYLRICLHADNTFQEVDELHQFLQTKLMDKAFKEVCQ